jgi:hypothetical protein
MILRGSAKQDKMEKVTHYAVPRTQVLVLQ